MEIKCNKCGYEFTARKEQTNKKRQCPECHSYDLTTIDNEKVSAIEKSIETAAEEHITQRYSKCATAVGTWITDKLGSVNDFDAKEIMRQIETWHGCYKLLDDEYDYEGAGAEFHDTDTELEWITFRFKENLKDYKRIIRSHDPPPKTEKEDPK